MKHLTTCLLWLVAVFQIVPVFSFPKIHWVGLKPEERSGRYIYKAAQTVHLNCTDAEKWETVSVEKGNPVLSRVHVRNTTSGKAPTIILTLQYNANQFVDVVKVKCKRNIFDDTVLIEQQYPTANVNITSANVTVNAGSKVKLTCLADGNPSAEYQWYNRTSKAVVVMVKGANKATFEITTPPEMSSVSLYQCRSRNSLNKPGQWVNSSSWMAVNSTYIPVIVTSITAPVSMALFPRKLTYQEANVTLNCSVPSAYNKEMRVTIEAEMVTGNPVSPQVRPKFVVKDTTMPAQIQIQYHPLTLIPLVKVTCHARNRTTGVTKTTLVQFIEQQYKTKNVVLVGPSSVSVSPGRTLTLRCLADGNPSPQYHWFNETRNGFVELTHAHAATLDLTATPNLPRSGVYKCGAGNKYNFEVVLSNATRVTKT